MPSEPGTRPIWSRVIGQKRVKQILLAALRTERLPHAYLFYGSDGVGKDAMALELARVLHCEQGGEEACGRCSSCVGINSLQHPDVKLVVALPAGKGEGSDDAPLAKLADADVKVIQEQLKLKGENPYLRVSIPRASIIKINSIRELRRESAMTTSGRSRRVFIISHADEMGEEAANTLLKTLEEPLGNTMTILTTAHRDALLSTIQSRCQAVRFDVLTDEEIKHALVSRNAVGEEQATLVARLANGNYLRALDLLQEDFSVQRETVRSFIIHALGNNVLALLDDIESLASARNREMVVRFLTLLLMWFRDALVLTNGGTIINVDQEDSLQRFVKKFPGADLARVLADIEKAISLVDRNVYIRLVLLQLSVQLKSTIIGPPRVVAADAQEKQI
jgi:DNA polymerase III subunit delta'